MNDDELQKKRYEAYMEEYKSLRTESLNTINNRISIMGFSFTALTLVGSVIVSANAPEIIVAIILGFVLPLLARTVTLVWIGEYQRSQRAGVAIALLENAINDLVGHKTLTWENTLRRRATKLVAPYESSIKLFVYIASISRILAIYYFSLANSHFFCSIIETLMATVIFLVLLLYVETLMRIRIRKAWLDARLYATHDGVRYFDNLKNSISDTEKSKPESTLEYLRNQGILTFELYHKNLISNFESYERKIWRKLLDLRNKN